MAVPGAADAGESGDIGIHEAMLPSIEFGKSF